MRPWTTRTLQAAVVAAGFAAAGTGTASAAPAPTTPMPDLSKVPDFVGFKAPVNTCQTPPGLRYGREKVPCADLEVNTQSPNVIKKVGADIATTSYGMAGELQDGKPLLAPGKPNRMLGHAFGEAARLEHTAKTRPDVNSDLDANYTGVLDDHSREGGLLKAHVWPRGPHHDGFSAADTAADLTLARGYKVEPLASPVGAVAPALENNPLQTNGAPVTLPKVEQVLPATKQVPEVPRLENGLADTAKQAPDAVAGTPRALNPQATLGKATGNLPSAPSAGNVTNALPLN